ncbi:MAG: hypothetical protein NT154_15255 [Verrucomicrobia bacterium]|nr:hypothetical protein [Verrucomicrobiota bacterium]
MAARDTIRFDGRQMIAGESLSSFGARLDRLEHRAASSGLLLAMIAGQVGRQRREIAAARAAISAEQGDAAQPREPREIPSGRLHSLQGQTVSAVDG